MRSPLGGWVLTLGLTLWTGPLAAQASGAIAGRLLDSAGQ